MRFVSLLLLRSFCWRLVNRYVLRSFNPAVVYYGAGTIGLAGGLTGVVSSAVRTARSEDGVTGMIVASIAVLLGLLALGTAIKLDAEANADLERPCPQRAMRNREWERDGRAPARTARDTHAE